MFQSHRVPLSSLKCFSRYPLSIFVTKVSIVDTFSDQQGLFFVLRGMFTWQASKLQICLPLLSCSISLLQVILLLS